MGAFHADVDEELRGDFEVIDVPRSVCRQCSPRVFSIWVDWLVRMQIVHATELVTVTSRRRPHLVSRSWRWVGNLGDSVRVPATVEAPGHRGLTFKRRTCERRRVDYDAIVIGAGHNGLTAATVMARDGMRVLLLEKNQYTGGMAATTELIRGYRHEIAGSILFPVPDEIYESLHLDDVPTLEPEVQSVNLGRPTDPPMLFWSDPDKLMNHLMGTMGMDAVLGLAEIAAWCEAPARALGRHEVRTEPKTLDAMFACATNERERDAIRTAMFGSVMDVIDRYLPEKERSAVLRGMLAFLSVNSTYRGPFTGKRDVSRVCDGHGRAAHAAQD